MSRRLEPTGAQLIKEERARQVAEEKFDAFRDAGYQKGELAMAAICYAWPLPRPEKLTVKFWPWLISTWKPRARGIVGRDDGRIRDLVRAGALIAAEIDRIARLEVATDPVENPDETTAAV